MEIPKGERRSPAFSTRSERSPEEQGFILCGHCPCLFLTNADREKHIEKFGNKFHEEEWKALHGRADRGIETEESRLSSGGWRKSQYGDGEYKAAVDEPFLVQLIHQNADRPTQNGYFMYRLSRDGKWINKKRADTV